MTTIPILPSDQFLSLKPGLYRDVPARVYHAVDCCSQSRCKQLASDTPEVLRYGIENPKPPTDALKAGNLLHALTLTPHELPKEYVLFRGDRRTKEDRERWAELCSQYGEAFVIREKDWQDAQEIRASILRRPLANRLLTHPEAERELSALWIEPETGLLCKSRFDLFFPKQGLIVDVKFMRPGSETSLGFSKAIAQYGYDSQAAFYLKACQSLGVPASSFGFVAVRKEAPYSVGYWMLDSEAVSYGWESLKGAIAQYAECERTGIWPGQDEVFRTLDTPSWRKYQIDNAGQEITDEN